MKLCSACGTSLTDDAAFCGACGKADAQATPGASPTAVSTQPARLLTPEATQAMRQAAAHAQSVAKNMGPEKIASLGGGVLGALGAVLPFYSLPSDSMLGAVNTASPSLVSEGGIGLSVIVLAIVLGAAPFVMVPSRLTSLFGFGLAAGVIGMLLGDRFGFSLFGQTISIDFGVGYYLALLGFAILAFGHGRRAYEAA